jgi:hypothetical protein
VSIIGAATQSTRKRIFLVGTGRGAVPVMRAGAAWRSVPPGDPRLAGLLLLSPNLHVQTPKPGQNAAYLPVAAQVPVPTLVYQPHLSSRYWHLEGLQAILRKAGVPLVVRTAPWVRDGFFGRREPLAAEVDLSARFPSVLAALLGELEATEP